MNNNKKLYQSIINNNIIAFIIFILLTSVTSYLYLNEVVERRNKINQVLANTITENIGQSLSKRISILDIVHYHTVTHDEVYEINNYLKSIVNGDNASNNDTITATFFTDIEIVNGKGTVIYSSNDQTLNFSYSGKKFFDELAYGNSGVYWSSPSISTTTNNLATNVTKKYKKGSYEYYIIGYLDLSDINIDALQRFDDTVNVSLTDAFGKYIFNTNIEKVNNQEYYRDFEEIKRNINKTSSMDFRTLFSPNRQITTASSLKGIADANSENVTLPDWYIIISQDSHSAYGYVMQIFILSLIIVAVGILLSGINSYFFAKGIDSFLKDFNTEIHNAMKENYNIKLKGIKYKSFQVIASNFEKLMNHVKSQEEELSNIAYRDQLTNLYNRYHLIEFLENQILKYPNKPITLIHIDLKNFKWINELYNHQVGDECIKHFSSALENLLENAKLICRLSGDEFIVIYTMDLSIESVRERFRPIKKYIKDGFFVNNQIIQLDYKGGIAKYPYHGKTAYELIQFSDIALKESKNHLNQTFSTYNDFMKLEIEENSKTINKVINAHEKNNYSLFFQPLIDLSNDKIIGFEVLLRLKDLDNKHIPPYQFIPILEENGLIIDLGYWIIEYALENLEKLNKKFNRELIISINISPLQLKSPYFIDNVQRIINKSTIKAEQVELEITESVFIDSYENTYETLSKLRNIGFNISLDDFGTGFSSLSYLTNLPLDTLKIDRSFMNNISDEKNMALFKSIVTIGHNLNLRIIAEGIEHREHLNFAKDFKCNIGQGYYWSKPLPFDDIIHNKKSFL